MKTFAFYLDAWLFCRDNGISRRRIKRINFHTYGVKHG
jgi:hypothetical protein